MRKLVVFSCISLIWGGFLSWLGFLILDFGATYPSSILTSLIVAGILYILLSGFYILKEYESITISFRFITIYLFSATVIYGLLLAVCFLIIAFFIMVSVNF